MAVGKVRIRSLVESKVAGATTLARLLENPRRTLTAILIGNNVANVAASAFATSFALSVLTQFGVTNMAISLTVITGVMTVLLLIFGEITPKSMVLKSPDKWALFYAKPLSVILFLFNPIVSLFQLFTVMISKLLGLPTEDAGVFLSANELKTMVRISQEEGILEKEEQDMIHSIMEFSDTVVREIMTPRMDAICIDVKAPVSDVIELIRQKGHSRIPVFEERIDNIVGIIYAKDLLNVKPEAINHSLHGFYRKAHFIPESKSIEPLFHQMKRDKFHMAIVMDEHGGFAGLVTLEDIIEEIIGDIQDEYDSEEAPEFMDIGNNHFLVDAKMSIDDFSKEININLEETDDYDTVGGFVLHLFDHMPDPGEVARFGPLEILVKAVKNRRILRLEVIKHVDTGDLDIDL